jgi:CRP/FNR family cyclic AMP-dependent transcriptional regulator
MSITAALASPDLVPALASSWFGGGLSPEAIARLASIATRRDVPIGTELFHEGQVTEAMSIVLAGRVALRTLVPERGMVTILTVDPGDVVGWSAIVPPHRATSVGIAIEPVTLIDFPGDRLRQLLREDYPLAASVYPRVMQAVARRLAATRLQLLDLFAREEMGRQQERAW